MAAVAVVVSLYATPATGAEGDPRLDEAVARLERAWDLASTGRLENAVRAAAELAGASPTEARLPRVAPPAGLPADLARPAARLLAAVGAAGELARDAVAVDPATLGRIHRRGLEALTSLRALDDSHPAEEVLARLDARVRRVVERGRLHGAADVLARAIDQALPELREAASSAPAARTPAGCDLADVPGALCVGGIGDNTYDEDYALQIDLGGADLYRNSAGGADPTGASLPVAVTIDVGGNDRYEATLPSPSGALAAQGGAHLGGVGVLVDAGGDDSYEIVTSPGSAGANGQGYSVAGVGILADLGGADDYVLRDASPATTTAGLGAQAAGQAFTGAAGVSLHLDVGAADDTRLVQSRPAHLVGDDGTIVPGYAYVFAYGMGILGAASVFLDDGGTDAMTAHAATVPVDPAYQGESTDSLAVVDAFGLGAFGTGVSLTGPGDTTRTTIAESAGPSVLGAVEDGFALGFAGFGGILDLGGDDAYVSRVDVDAARRLEVNDACDCAGVEAHTASFTAEITGLGFGWSAGVGLTRDLGGNDRYDFQATMRTEAVALDRRTIPVEPGPDQVEGARATAEGGTTVGVMMGAGFTGAGFLQDLAGDDVYRSVLHNESTARAESSLPGAPEVAVSSVWATTLVAQAAGYIGSGYLEDTTGADRYETVAESVVAADPPSFEDPGMFLTAVQAGAAEGGAGLLVDGPGGDDVFTSTPEQPACMGSRGEGVWRDCGSALGLGVNA